MVCKVCQWVVSEAQRSIYQCSVRLLIIKFSSLHSPIIHGDESRFFILQSSYNEARV